MAWNLLTKRYNNRRAIVQTHMRALFELPNITKENAIELRRVADSATKHIQALKALRCPTEHWDVVLIHLISSKFDTITAKEWQTTLIGTELPTFKQFAEFLSRRCQLLESLIGSKAYSQPVGRRISAHVAATASSCGYCRGQHLIYYCREFLRLSVSQRVAEARKRRLCTNCLKENNHSSGKCSAGSCKVCGHKHNSLLHVPAKSNEIPENSKTGEESARGPCEGTAVMTHSSVAYDSHVLLSTAIVYIADASGVRGPCRVLLDSGSQANFITRLCVKRLGLKSRPGNVKITGINGMVSSANEIVKINLQLRLNRFSAKLECVLTDRITDRIPASPISRESVRIPRNLKLADPEFYRCSDVDVLVGVELFWSLMCIGTIRSSCDYPTLQKTHLGWIVAGRLNDNGNKIKDREVGAFHAAIADAGMQQQLTKFWRVEESFRPRDSYTAIERFCEQHFQNSTTRSRGARRGHSSL